MEILRTGWVNRIFDGQAIALARVAAPPAKVAKGVPLRDNFAWNVAGNAICAACLWRD
jgi:hypothetical protein